MSFRSKLRRRAHNSPEPSRTPVRFGIRSEGPAPELDEIFDDGEIVLVPGGSVHLTIPRVDTRDLSVEARACNPVLDLVVDLFDGMPEDLLTCSTDVIAEQLTLSLQMLLVDDFGDIPDLDVECRTMQLADVARADEEIFLIRNAGPVTVRI